MMASSFVKAMDSINHLSTGENGALEYTAKGVQESRVALFFALVRDLSDTRLIELMKLVLDDAKINNDPEMVADVFLMAFQTRHCRGGKGERDLFYKMMMELVMVYPQTVERLMYLVPHYGSFKDWFQFVSIATDEKLDESKKRAMLPVVNTIMDLATDQLLKDKSSLDELEEWGVSLPTTTKVSSFSLLAKWAPREKKRFHNQVRVLANKLFPASKAPKKEYRQLISRLNKAINCTEVLMSADKWNEIDFFKVPSICLLKHRKAFLNEKINDAPSSTEEETGNRHPHNERRVECRKRLRGAMSQGKSRKLKGRQLYPHEVVSKFMRGQNLSTLEKELLSCQWADIRTNVVTAMDEVHAKNISDQTWENGEPSTCVDLGKIVPIVDVSGSMHGTPIQVAVALGILVSELANPAFANRCLTFSEQPSWVCLDDCESLEEKVTKLENAPWGMNTDFEKATELVLQAAINAKLDPDEIPDLIVFSDMQFDQARNSRGDGLSHHTHHHQIVRRFKDAGLQVCGKAWPAPHIIYWNLRGATNGFPAQGDTPNVTMLSGFSPSLLKLLLNGLPLKEIAPEKNDSFLTVRAALDADDYNEVRLVLSTSNENFLRGYKPSEDSIRTVVATQDIPRNKDNGWELVN